MSRNGIITKLFSWECLAGGRKLFIFVNNPNVSGMLVTLPNIEKITLSTFWLLKVKGHGHPELTVSSSCYKFRKFSNLATVLFLDIFRSYLEKLLLIKLSLTLEILIAKYQKVCEISWAKLGTKW